MKKCLISCSLVLLALAAGCRKAEVTAVPNQPRLILLPPQRHPHFSDDFPHEDLLRALDAQLLWFATHPETNWRFGERRVDVATMERTLTRFRAVWVAEKDQPQRLQARIAELFDVYELGFGAESDILLTGYYAPIFEGNLSREGDFQYPLYRLPPDLVAIRPSLFDDGLLKAGDALRGDRVMARLSEGGEVVPYYTREQIDKEGRLAGKNLELVYLDDYFAVFTLHVQGGGFVRLPSGELLSVQYVGKNGWPYTSIGKLLVAEGRISAEAISMQAIGTYFAENPAEVQRVCFANRSYVFYASDGKRHARLEPEFFPHGVLGFPVTPKRSIATDKRFFPGGALTFVSGQQRRRDGSKKPFSAFVLDQDTGGAIKGAHVDFFLGAGEAAAEDAGLLNDPHGRVYFLVIKETAPN